MRARHTLRLATIAAAALLALAPATAVAQPSGTPEDTDSGAAPPPLDGDRSVPADDGRPDLPYTPKADEPCVRATSSGFELQTIPWGQDVLRFRDLPQFASGRGQTVAVIDTGVSPHAYLGTRLEGAGDYVQNGGDGLDDCDGHGTEVAGIIAANPERDDIGFRGIAPDARILSIRQSSGHFEFKPADRNDPRATDGAGSVVTLAKAVVRAAKRGASVINMSVDTCRLASKHPPGGPLSPAERDLQRALRYAVEDENVVLVAAAGNLGKDGCPGQNTTDTRHPRYIVSPPWFSDYVLSVAAVGRDGAVAPFSMLGPWVSVAAPGTDIISLAPDTSTQLANETVSENGDASRIQGTSFAAPYVAGLAALVRERFPDLRAEQVMKRIKITASHPAAAGGHDSRVGYGMINPIGALTAMIPAEHGIPGDEAVDTPFRMPPAQPRDWGPARVAVIGTGGGLGLLLLTLFVVHTVRRQRRDHRGSA